MIRAGCDAAGAEIFCRCSR